MVIPSRTGHPGSPCQMRYDTGRADQLESYTLGRALSDSLGWTQRTCNQGLSDCTLTPLGQGGGSAVFENVAASERAWVVAHRLWIEAWTAVHVCRGLMSLTRAIAPVPPSTGLM